MSECLKVELTDENPVSLTEIAPIVGEEGKKLVPYHFTLTNTCTMNAKLSINLEVLNTTTFKDLSYMKVMLNEKGPTLS